MTGTVQIHEHGGPEILQYDQVEIGPPEPGEVRLRQTAVGVNYLDVYFRQGDISPASFPFVNGFEGAGIIEELGEGVSGLGVGQRVAYQLVMGAYAEERNLPAERLVPLPSSIGDETAAAMMLKGTTAEYLLNRARPVKPGESILVHAAASGSASIIPIRKGMQRKRMPISRAARQSAPLSSRPDIERRRVT